MELDDIKDKKSSSGLSQVITREDVAQEDVLSYAPSPSAEVYRLYKRRWLGLIGLCLLNIISGLNGLWFSAIAIDTSEQFDVSLSRVNWLGNCINMTYLPVSLLVPLGFARWGLRISCAVGSFFLLIAAWIRYAGTAHGLSSGGRYGLLLVAQVFTGFGQPWFQILGPKYSETWFDLRGRTTATMIIAISNPIGGALSQLIAPAFSTVRQSILILAILTTALVPTFMLIYPKPPTPPTYAGSHPSTPAAQIFRAWVGKARPGEAVMSLRERFDMAIVTVLFAALVGAFGALSNLISQIFEPYGYTSSESGIMGGVLILTGIVGAAITSPIFDRYLTHHLAIAVRVLIPLLAASYIALIWDVRANNNVGLYVVMVFIGISSFTLLPIALEIGCEVTRSAETSSAILWFAGNISPVIFVLAMDALRDNSPSANPPGNMRKALIFQACVVSVAAVTVFGLKGQQTRRELDIQKQAERQGLERDPVGRQ